MNEPAAATPSRPSLRGARRYVGWLVVPLGFLLASQFWPTWPRTHQLVLDLGGNSPAVTGVEITWTLSGEDAPRGGARRMFPRGAPRRLTQPIYGPSGAWEIQLVRAHAGPANKTTSQHRVTLDGEETILFIKD